MLAAVSSPHWPPTSDYLSMTATTTTATKSASNTMKDTSSPTNFNEFDDMASSG